MKESAENQIERLLETPYWVIDFLPETVSAERSKQYFDVEEFLKPIESVRIKYG